MQAKKKEETAQEDKVMKEILIKGQLNKFKSFEEFVKEFQLGKGDLLFTNKFIYDEFAESLDLTCQVLFQEKFGAGEPSEDMIQTFSMQYRKTPTTGSLQWEAEPLWTLENCSPSNGPAASISCFLKRRK